MHFILHFAKSQKSGQESKNRDGWQLWQRLDTWMNS